MFFGQYEEYGRDFAWVGCLGWVLVADGSGTPTLLCWKGGVDE